MTSGKENKKKPLPEKNEDVEKSVPVATDADTWPLEADRIAIQTPLIDSLRLLAGHYGRRTSVSSLTAGLPLP